MQFQTPLSSWLNSLALIRKEHGRILLELQVWSNLYGFKAKSGWNLWFENLRSCFWYRIKCIEHTVQWCVQWEQRTFWGQHSDIWQLHMLCDKTAYCIRRHARCCNLWDTKSGFWNICRSIGIPIWHNTESDQINPYCFYDSSLISQNQTQKNF